MPILQVRDKDGNFMPIPAIKGDKGEKGDKGKSAYEQAKEGGYAGTEEEFIALLDDMATIINDYKQAGASLTEISDAVHEHWERLEAIDGRLEDLQEQIDNLI